MYLGIDGMFKSLPTTPLAIHVQSEKAVRWEGFARAFYSTRVQLAQLQFSRHITAAKPFVGLKMAYSGLIWPDLSIDLVAASLRQRGFAKRITR